MNENMFRHQVHEAIDTHSPSYTADPYRVQRVIRQAHATKKTGGMDARKKISVGFVLAITAILALTSAVAATLLWRNAGEKIAPMEGKNGSYATWNTEAKLELLQALYDLGELKDNPDTERVLGDADRGDVEKNELCDRILSAYVHGSIDTVSLLSVLETLHGDMSTWSMEDLVWYNELLSENEMLSDEDTNYVLAQDGEVTQEQAVESARTFLISKGAENLERAQIEATFYEETEDRFYGKTQISWKGRRVWSVVFRRKDEQSNNVGTFHADVAVDGSIITYSLPEFAPVFITGLLPDMDAISDAKAIELGASAIAAEQAVSTENMKDIRAFFGYIDLDDEEAAHAKLGERVWLVNTDEGYALVSREGEVLFVGSHEDMKEANH